MSDSDDTEVLLLIPPNFFFVSNEWRSQGAKIMYETPEDPYGAAVTSDKVVSPGQNYEFLTSSRKRELKEINSCLQTLGEVEGNEKKFDALSDISTISNGTRAEQNERVGIIHSTPKYSPLNELEDGGRNANILAEIDDFFYERNGINKWEPHHNYRGAKPFTSELNYLQEKASETVQSGFHTDANLISLSDIWGKSGRGTAIACTTVQKSSIREEQLRRQHLERMVQSLQSQILEYQQRLSVAIEVDRAKDEALCNAQTDCKNLNGEVNTLRSLVTRLEAEQKEYKNRIDGLQKERDRAVDLSKNLQDDKTKMESKLSTLSRKAVEDADTHKQKVEDLETKLIDCKHAEELAVRESNKIKDKFAKLENLNERLNMQCKDLEQERETLRKRKEFLHELHQKQKFRVDTLEMQAKTMQESIKVLTENEITLKKKIDLQQKTLKNYYQEQLEKAVTQKLDEFRGQLEKTEEQLKAKAREREHLLAERAVKQIELINEKNELELNLLQEKHKEEVDLYRIQLANASKKIDELETKLNSYKTKRSIIAEKLHGIMETQWQKALEILTSPNSISHLSNDTDMDTNADCEKSKAGGNNRYETPKTSKRVKNGDKRDNSNNNSSIEPMDRLQAFIELLLSKSPGDFEKLDEILAKTVKSRSLNPSEKPNRSSRRLSYSKPPWRA